MWAFRFHATVRQFDDLSRLFTQDYKLLHLHNTWLMGISHLYLSNHMKGAINLFFLLISMRYYTFLQIFLCDYSFFFSSWSILQYILSLLKSKLSKTTHFTRNWHPPTFLSRLYFINYLNFCSLFQTPIPDSIDDWLYSDESKDPRIILEREGRTGKWWCWWLHIQLSS